MFAVVGLRLKERQHGGALYFLSIAKSWQWVIGFARNTSGFEAGRADQPVMPDKGFEAIWVSQNQLARSKALPFMSLPDVTGCAVITDSSWGCSSGIQRLARVGQLKINAPSPRLRFQIMHQALTAPVARN